MLLIIVISKNEKWNRKVINMLLFLIFALVVVIATGIPFVKKSIENRKVLKEYIEEGLGKNEAIGKIKDTKTTNDKDCFMDH